MNLLCVLETSQYPSGPCFKEVALLVNLDGEHPSSGHIVLRFDNHHVNDASENCTVCSIFELPELMILFEHEISSWPLSLLLFHK